MNLLSCGISLYRYGYTNLSFFKKRSSEVGQGNGPDRPTKLSKEGPPRDETANVEEETATAHAKLASLHSPPSEPCAPADLSTLEEEPRQPKYTTYPGSTIDGKLRSFNSNWYGKYKWLEYSPSVDSVFCKPCRHFPDPHIEKNLCQRWIQKLETNWACV